MYELMRLQVAFRDELLVAAVVAADEGALSGLHRTKRSVNLRECGCAS